MFEKISGKHLSRLFLWKYIFQLLIAPLCLSVCACAICLIVLSIKNGFFVAVKEMFGNNGRLNDLQAITIVMYFCNLLNICSLPMCIKLIFDCIKNQEVEQVTKITKLFPCIELPTVRQKKRFICDTFSKKKNVEIYVYDEAGKKYRFFWNENYGGSSEEVERVLLEEVTVKIKYLKYSKIIVACEILNDNAEIQEIR